jgi:hypothetical protein
MFVINSVHDLCATHNIGLFYTQVDLIPKWVQMC